MYFFFDDTATSEIYTYCNTLLLHDARPISVATHGPDSVAFYVSGQLLTEDYYVANKLMKGFIGSANIDTNSRLCMASSVAGHVRAFGSDTVPGTYEDLRSEEHKYELQSLMRISYAVLCLQKKKKQLK